MASISVSNSIIVNAPIDKVFYIGTDPERQKEWMSNDDELRGYTPPVEVGSTFETVSKFMGREVVVSNEVVVNDAPHRCDYAMSGTMNGIIEHHFEEVNGGVKVTIVLNRTERWAAFWELLPFRSSRGKLIIKSRKTSPN